MQKMNLYWLMYILVQLYSFTSLYSVYSQIRKKNRFLMSLIYICALSCFTECDIELILLISLILYICGLIFHNVSIRTVVYSASIGILIIGLFYIYDIMFMVGILNKYKCLLIITIINIILQPGIKKIGIYIRRRNLMNIFLTSVTYIISLTGICIVLMPVPPSDRLPAAILLFFTTTAGFLLAIKTSFNYRKTVYKIAELSKNSEYNTIRLSYLEENNQKLRAIRHDTVNHMTVIAQFLNDCESSDTAFNKGRIKMLNYINNFFDIISSETTYVSTGNIELDNLINSKLKLMEDEQISCDHHIFLPDNMSVDAFDLNTILGNLLDNAIQAVQKLHSDGSGNLVNNRIPDFPDIVLSIMYDRGCIHIKIVNLCVNNDIRFEYDSDTNEFIVPDFLASTKEDAANHGFGIKNVINIVEKYNGTLHIQKNENLFLTNINIIM